MEDTLLIPQTGMQKDQDSIRQTSQEYKHALNAVIEGFDGKTFAVQNEPSNLLSIKLRDGQKIIGFIYISSLEKTIAFTTNSKGSDDIIVWDTINHNDDAKAGFETTPLENIVQKPIATYRTLISSVNFGWNINNKVSIKYKLTDCTLNLYFVDGYNPDRFIYFNYDLSLVDDFKKTSYINDCDFIYLDLDINKTQVNQFINYPKIDITSEAGGDLSEGVYQIFVAYTTSKGIPLSSYSGSNTFPIFEKVEKQIENQVYKTNSSLKVNLTNVSLNSYYKFISIIVSSTINDFTSYRQVATLPVNEKITYIYSTDVNSISKSESDVFAKYPYYENSAIIETSGNYLFKADVSEYEKFNIQRIANLIELEAVTIKVEEDFYKNPENNNKYKSYLRDEVYSFGFELILTEGEISGVGHIPGRKAIQSDLLKANNIEDITDNKRDLNWQVNNTAVKILSPHLESVWDVFNFAYWESSEKYPNNRSVWGDLCNTNIRHHKFPDCSISHIHDGDNVNILDSYNRKTFIFPMGVRIKNINSLSLLLDDAVVDGIISQKQRNRIVGYRIVRGDRSGQKSIVAKGMLYDVWNYEKPAVYNETDTCAAKIKYYYPNIGFNDLRKDPFLAKDSEHYKYNNFDRGIQNPNLLEFTNEGKYTFHSPDTSYVQPKLGNVLKLETEEYGQSKGFFNVSENQAEYKLLNYNHYNLAILIATFIGNNTEHKSSNASGTGQAMGSLVGSIAGSAIPGIGTAIGGTVGGIIGSLAGGKDDATAALQRNATILYQTEKLLQIFKNLADFQKLQYQYQAIGKYKAFIKILPNGNKQRKINVSSYLTPTKQTINNNFINNNFRESSVYLDLERILPSTVIQDTSKNKIKDTTLNSTTFCKKYKVNIGNNAFNVTNGLLNVFLAFQDCNGVPQRWVIGKPEERILTASIPPSPDTGITITEINCPECPALGTYTTKDCKCKGEEVTSTIASYYASIKSEKLNQYGNIFGVNYLNTENSITSFEENKVYFGGDTFITPHSFKRKHSYFNNTTFGLPDETDIYYQDLGNVAYPTYFFNTKETSKALTPSTSLLFDLYRFGNFSGSTYSFWSSVFGNNPGFYTASFIIDNFSLFAFNPQTWIKAPNYYLDCNDNNVKSKPLGLFNFNAVKGISYLYNYAIPVFYCESDINTYYRTSKNNKDLDFYPNQSDLNYWLQEKNVPINSDNFYFYDRTYSKQNREGFHYVNDINFNPNKLCKISYPNRVIYSLESGELDDSDYRDNYLINRALDYYDFSQVNGKLIGLHGIESDKVLVNFENNLQIYSAYSTLQTDQNTVFLGNGSIFRSKPQEFSKTNLGYLGSQHTAFLSTEFGHLMVDAKRGQIFVIGVNGNGATDITKDNLKNWFKTNLPFNISKYFKVNIDNNFAGIGISLCFDKRYSRILLTKLDYEPRNKNITFNNNKFYLGTTEVFLTDRKHFYNKSFTISYSFITNSWVSFHSYTPNYYIENTNYFMSGTLNGVWSHNLTDKSYQVFYGKKQSFEVELSDKYDVVPKLLQSVFYTLDSFRYYNDLNNVKTNIGFNKAIIYNDSQCSGVLNLELSDNKDLFKNKKYPILENYYTTILQTSKESKFSFNQFRNRNNNSNLPMFINNQNGVDKNINLNSISNNLDNSYNPIRGNINYIKLSQDLHTNYKLVFKLANFNQNYSIR